MSEFEELSVFSFYSEAGDSKCRVTSYKTTLLISYPAHMSPPLDAIGCIWVPSTHTPVPVAARSAAARLLRSWVRIPPGAWTFVSCECCVLSGRGLCDKLPTCPEESYSVWRVVVCVLLTSCMRRHKLTQLWLSGQLTCNMENEISSLDGTSSR